MGKYKPINDKFNVAAPQKILRFVPEKYVNSREIIGRWVVDKTIARRKGKGLEK